MTPITKLPYGWPTDKRTKRTTFNNQIVLLHPDRAPMVSTDGRTWRTLEIMPETGVVYMSTEVK